MNSDPRLRVSASPEAVASAAADHLAELLRSALAARRVVTFAVSGGSTPGATFAALRQHDLEWDRVMVVQVDERVAAILDGDRNLTMHQAALAAHLDLYGLLSMPVTEANLDRAAAAYAADLAAVAGDPIVLDVVQLGLGSDGHTASLFTGDAALEEQERPVAVTGKYQGRLRMTLTVPVLVRARHRVWIATGANKHEALAATLAGDTHTPAARVAGPEDVFFVDDQACVRA